MRTVCLDFDGVIHGYKSGWKGYAVITDPPVPGVKEAIDELRKTYMVKVFSTRCKKPEGREAIKKYLEKYDISVSAICEEKPSAFIYVDDRGFKFDGNWSAAVEAIKNFKSWLE
jgi:predicted phosphatase